MSERKKGPLYYIYAFIGLVIFALTLWYAVDVVLLGFAAILFAIFLQTLSSWISWSIKLPYRLVLVLVILIIIALLALFFFIATPLMLHQFSILIEEVPKAYEQLKTGLGDWTDGKFKGTLAETFIFKNEKFFSQASAVFSFTVGTVTSFVIFILVGIYIAFNPPLYIQGFLRVFPPRRRPQIQHLLSKLGETFRWWILGKFMSMTVIGILTIIGLWILKMPLAFILGLLIALFTFIPYIGPILASIPAILIALSIDPWLALYVTILYLVIHAIEGYFITPLIEQKTVSLPPALTVMVQILLMLLVGFLGLVLASPLTVVMIVLCSELYVLRRRGRRPI